MAVISFFAGTQFPLGKKQSSNERSFGNNFPLGDENAENPIMRKAGLINSVNLISGEIIDKDDFSLTVKLQEGGSKIVFFSDSTFFMKSVENSAEDFTVGEQISVIGSANDDGSVTTQSIQIRPEMNFRNEGIPH